VAESHAGGRLVRGEEAIGCVAAGLDGEIAPHHRDVERPRREAGTGPVEDARDLAVGDEHVAGVEVAVAQHLLLRLGDRRERGEYVEAAVRQRLGLLPVGPQARTAQLGGHGLGHDGRVQRGEGARERVDGRRVHDGAGQTRHDEALDAEPLAIRIEDNGVRRGHSGGDGDLQPHPLEWRGVVVGSEPLQHEAARRRADRPRRRRDTAVQRSLEIDGLSECGRQSRGAVGRWHRGTVGSAQLDPVGHGRDAMSAAGMLRVQ
jgi:hypothetical protein